MPQRSLDPTLRDNAPQRYVVISVMNGMAPGPLVAYLYDLGAVGGYRLVVSSDLSRALIPDSLFPIVRAPAVACLTLSHRALADEAEDAARTPSEVTAGSFFGPTISGAP